MKIAQASAAVCLCLQLASVSGATECPLDWTTLHPEWIWCDDFETDKSASYFDKSVSFRRVAGVGYRGSHGMQAAWQPGMVDAGSLKVAFGLTPPGSGIIPPEGVDATTRFREIYYRVYLKSGAGWNSGTISNQSKLSRATSFVAADWSQAMIAHLWSSDSNSNILQIDPASCVRGGAVHCLGYNDFARLAWLGVGKGATAVFAAPNAGAWICIEAHVRLNDPGSSDGVQEFWIDSRLEARRTGLDFVGSYGAHGINAVLLENYINNGAPRAQSRYWDNLVVSTRRIGCLPRESPAARHGTASAYASPR